MKKVLISGATGYLGKYLVKECKQRGYWVRALARNAAKLDSVKDSVDDVFIGEATRSETLEALCQGIDIVISALGVASSRTNETVPLEEVDYGGNCNILKQAVAAGVKKFVYVSFIKTPDFENLEITRIKERFIRELRGSGLPFCILQPTAFFSDMGEIMKQAMKGTVYLLGSGQSRSNAIHGIDLAKVCVDAVESAETEIPVGGPEVLSYQEAAELAFRILGRPPRIKKIPAGPFVLLLKLLRPLLSRRKYTLIQFLLAAFTHDAIAPSYGTHTLEMLFRETAAQGHDRTATGNAAA